MRRDTQRRPRNPRKDRDTLRGGTPGDHAPGITPNANEPKKNENKEPEEVHGQKRAVKPHQCASPRR